MSSGIGVDESTGVIVGATDGTEIGNVDDRLKVDADVTSTELPSDTPGCPVLSVKFRFDVSEDDLALTDTFQTLYSYTGSGKFISFIFDFDRSNVDFKITIDTSNVIIDSSSNFINDVQIDSIGRALGTSGIGWDNIQSKLLFEPHCPVVFNSEFKVEAKENFGNTVLNRYIVSLTKET